ncbi:MAG: LytR/AlgR family response regulator transcription factor [Christensenellales bacterium]|jgi:DNA-binding LytR/AlgR family response regulator
MTRIAIVEDDRFQADRLARMVARWDARARVSQFENAEALLFASEEFDILILDIQMPGMDGMALAKLLRGRGVRAQMIFATAVCDFLADGYDVDAVNYLVKPIEEAQLLRALDRAKARTVRARRTVVLGGVRYYADEIISCEAHGHDVLIRTAAGTHTARSTMRALEEALGAGFFRCQRSFIAGLSHVRRVTRAALEMDDGTEIPLGRAHYDAAMRAFIDHNWSQSCDT